MAIKTKADTMGFDTYITVGDRRVVQYRKNTGSLPRFLFDRSELRMEIDEDGESLSRVHFQSTAAGVLRVLDEQGQGWHSCVAAYASVMAGGGTEAFYGGFLSATIARDEDLSYEDASIKVDELIAEYRQVTPEEDLVALSQLLASSWLDEDVEDILLFELLSYDEPVEVSSSLLRKALRLATEKSLPEIPIGRATETIALLFRQAPLVAWPLLITILLQALPPDTPVTYELTEGIYEFGMDDQASASAVIDDYWEETGAFIASYAHTLGVLFGTLAAFETRLGRPYWFGQTASAIAQLEKLNLDRSTSTTKERGDALERVVEALFQVESPDLIVTGKNLQSEEEEIDLMLSNRLADPFWTNQHSPFVVVECKNWSGPVGVQELRVFESKIEDRKGAVRIGIFFSTNGYAKTFVERLKVIQSRGLGTIYALDLDDIKRLVERQVRLSDWLPTPDGSLTAFNLVPRQ